MLASIGAAAEISMIRFRFGSTLLWLVPTVLALTPAEGRAWSAEGHMIVALVADRLLQAQESPAQRKIAELLAGDKSNNWTRTDIAGEATWADALLEKTIEGRIATTKWHYVKLDPANPDLTKACFGRPALPEMAPASHGSQDDCAVDKIEQFAKELRDPATLPGERLMALQFLLNLVGDIHDPLFTIEHNDQGGQCVALSLPGAKAPVRLRSYWEDTLVAEAEGRDPAKAADAIVAGLTPAEIRKWSGSSPADWAQESNAVAKDVVYSFEKEGAKEAEAGKYAFPTRKGEKDPCGPVPVYHVDAVYRERAIAAVKEQLTKAGIRLASLLRDNLQ
jgi:S1/P1 Nuclease